MLLAFDLLLFVELTAPSDGLILRQQVLGVRTGRNGRRRLAATQTAPGAGNLQARREAFEIAFLFR